MYNSLNVRVFCVCVFIRTGKPMSLFICEYKPLNVRVLYICFHAYRYAYVFVIYPCPGVFLNLLLVLIFSGFTTIAVRGCGRHENVRKSQG